MEPLKTLEPSTSVVSSAKVTARDRKGSQFFSILEAAYNKAGLNPDEAQRVNHAVGAGDHLREFIEEHRHLNEFANEEVESSYGYLSGYKKPKEIPHQIKIIHKLFAGKWEYFRPNEDEIKVHEAAEGQFAIPNWRKNPKIFGSTYSEAVQKILDKLDETRKGAFHNYRKGEIDEKHLRQSAKSEKFWKKLAETQGNPDILLVPAQFGIRHRGRSVRRARVVMGESECGLGAFAGGCMLLTHPERLQNVDDLWIDLSGDEFSPDADRQFSGAPCFRFSDGGLEFDAVVVGFTHGRYGSGSVFSPQ